MPRLRAIMLLSLATSLFVPAAFAQNTNNARPGTINYVEGQATLNGQPLTAAIGRHGGGRHPARLSPRRPARPKFCSLPESSCVSATTAPSPWFRPTSPKPKSRSTVALPRSKSISSTSRTTCSSTKVPAQTVLLKNGLYEFDANAKHVRVFDGRGLGFAGRRMRRSGLP